MSASSAPFQGILLFALIKFRLQTTWYLWTRNFLYMTWALILNVTWNACGGEISLDYNKGSSKVIPSVIRHKACCAPLKTHVPEVIFGQPLTPFACLISDFPIFPTTTLTYGTLYSERLVPNLTKKMQHWNWESPTILHSISLYPEYRYWYYALIFKWQKVDFWLEMPLLPPGELARLITK